MVLVLLHEALAHVLEGALGRGVPPVGEGPLGVKVPARAIQGVEDLVGQGQAQGAQVQVLGDPTRVVGVLDQPQRYHWNGTEERLGEFPTLFVCFGTR